MTGNSNLITVFIKKLRRLQPLENSDVEALNALSIRPENIDRHQRLVREGEVTQHCCLLVRGYAARFKVAASGTRQIVSFHIPGDLLDIQHLLLPIADHSVVSITPARVAWIPKEELIQLAWTRPAIGKALWKDSLIDASIFREWVLNVGQRTAKARIAHMVCEFVARSEAVGSEDRSNFQLPMTQQEIADATGLTAVHVNRTLKLLDQEGAIERDRNRFKVLDWGRLCSIGEFRPAYLHTAA